MIFKRKNNNIKHSFILKKQGGNSHKDPLQHSVPSDEELYPHTLEMVDYLNQKPRSYIIDLHLISDQNNLESKSLFVQKKPKANKFLPAFYISFCLNGKIEDYALNIRLFGPNKEVILLSAPITMLSELTPSYHDNQNNFISFQFTPKEEIKATPGVWVCLAQLQKITDWKNENTYAANVIAEKEFEFPIIKRNGIKSRIN